MTRGSGREPITGGLQVPTEITLDIALLQQGWGEVEEACTVLLGDGSDQSSRPRLGGEAAAG